MSTHLVKGTGMGSESEVPATDGGNWSSTVILLEAVEDDIFYVCLAVVDWLLADDIET